MYKISIILILSILLAGCKGDIEQPKIVPNQNQDKPYISDHDIGISESVFLKNLKDNLTKVGVKDYEKKTSGDRHELTLEKDISLVYYTNTNKNVISVYLSAIMISDQNKYQLLQNQIIKSINIDVHTVSDLIATNSNKVSDTFTESMFELGEYQVLLTYQDLGKGIFSADFQVSYYVVESDDHEEELE